MESMMDDGSLYSRRPKEKFSVEYTKLRTQDLDSEEDDLYDHETAHLVNQSNGGCLSGDDGSSNEGTFTVEEAVDSLGFGFFQVKLFIISGLFSAADALEMMLLAVISPVLRCEWQLEKYQVAFITTVVFIGMGSMAPIWGAMGDKYGRRSTLFLVGSWIGYFGLLTTFSPSYGWVLFLRGLVGGGMGGTPQSFALLTEYLPSTHRAKLLNLGQIAWALGTSFEITLAAWVIPTLGWRWLLLLSAIPSFLIVILMKALPESARYLVAAGQTAEAYKTLVKAAKTNKSILPEGKLIASKVVKSRGQLKDLFSKQYIRTTFQVWFLWFVTAFSYYGMVLASAEILQMHNEKNAGGESCNCNLLKMDDYYSMIISTFGEFISLPINMLLIDLVGRRYTGAIDLAGCSLFFILLQLNVPKYALTAIMFMVRGFSAATFNFSYIYTAEVYPTSVRTLGIGTASAWARVGAMITPFIAQVLLDQSIRAAVGVYGTLGLMAALCCLLLPIETKARKLPQFIDAEE